MIARASIIIGLLVATPSKAVADTTCPTSGDAPATIASIEPRLEITLTDGRLLRLTGLDPALQTPDDPDGAETARATFAAMVVGHAVTVRPMMATTDRWGRLPAQVFLSATPERGGLATTAVAAGLGRYLAEPAAHGCRDALVAAETKARDGKLGLWADPYYAVLAVDDRAGFTERAGTIILAEGRLAAILPGPYRTKLRFASRDQAPLGGRTLNAVILPRPMKTFEAQRVDFRALIGRKLRLRGLLDQRFGPQIELNGPDDVDVLDTPVGAAP